MPLDKTAARPLTSREIAKVVGGVLGSFVEWCGAEPVIDAINHLAEHRGAYADEFRQVELMATMLRQRNNDQAQ